MRQWTYVHQTITWTIADLLSVRPYKETPSNLESEYKIFCKAFLQQINVEMSASCCIQLTCLTIFATIPVQTCAIVAVDRVCAGAWVLTGVTGTFINICAKKLEYWQFGWFVPDDYSNHSLWLPTSALLCNKVFQNILKLYKMAKSFLIYKLRVSWSPFLGLKFWGLQ